MKVLKDLIIGLIFILIGMGLMYSLANSLVKAAVDTSRYVTDKQIERAVDLDAIEEKTLKEEIDTSKALMEAKPEYIQTEAGQRALRAEAYLQDTYDPQIVGKNQ